MSRLRIKRAGEKQAKWLAQGQEVFALCEAITQATEEHTSTTTFAGRKRGHRGVVVGGPWFAETETTDTAVDAKAATAIATATSTSTKTQQQASQKTVAGAGAAGEGVASSSAASSFTKAPSAEAVATTTAAVAAAATTATVTAGQSSTQPGTGQGPEQVQGPGPGPGQGEVFYDVQFTLSTADVTGAVSSSGSHPPSATPASKASSTVVVERVSRVHILAPYMYPPQALADFLQTQGQGLEAGASEGPLAALSETLGAPPSRPILIPLTMLHLPTGETHTLFTATTTHHLIPQSHLI